MQLRRIGAQPSLASRVELWRSLAYARHVGQEYNFDDCPSIVGRRKEGIVLLPSRPLCMLSHSWLPGACSRAVHTAPRLW
jgi:hypothetical protein